MPVTCRDIMNAVEKMAPLHMAEGWDNSGLQLGDPDQQVKRILVALDLVEQVAWEAVENHVDMVVTHHPFLFNPVKSFREDCFTGRVASLMIRNRIALYCAHTNLDAAYGGINDVLSEKLGLVNIEGLDIAGNRHYNKVVVYVPVSHEDKVRNAMTDAGAGWIGQYSHCTFQVRGTGTCMPCEGSNPYIGNVGQLEKIDEYRIETIVPAEITDKVIEQMIKAHPYEEVAYDIFRLENHREGYGVGRVGQLKEETTVEHFAKKVKDVLAVDRVVVSGCMSRKVKRVALCGGSGGDLIENAAAAGADVFLTGDIKYHQAQDALARDMAVIDAGHFGTEKVSVDILKYFIEKEINNVSEDVEIMKSSININPFIFM